MGVPSVMRASRCAQRALDRAWNDAHPRHEPDRERLVGAGLLVQKPAPVPPPTKVGHSPQPSTMARGTVVAWPGVARSTMKSTALLPAGTVKVWPLAIGWPSRVTFAFWN